MTLTTGQDEQVTEFRVGTVNDLLIAAKGGTTEAAGDAKRFKSLALAGGVSSAVLALALVVVLITGTGSKSSSSKTATTSAPVALLPKPANTFDVPFSVSESLAPLGINRGDTVTLAGINSSDQTTPIVIHNVFVRGVETKDSQTAGQQKIANKLYQLAVPDADQPAYLSLSPKQQKLLGGGSGTASTAPPTTQAPPATQPATTPPSR